MADKLPVKIKKFFPATASAIVGLSKMAGKRDVKKSNFRVALTADLHTDADVLRDRTNILRKAFAGVTKYGKFDALVMAGDITNSAHVLEYNLLRRLVNVYLKGQTIVPQMGNHDARGTSIYPDFEEATQFFQEFCAFCNIKTDKNYYKLNIKGYDFIVLGTEKLLKDEAEFSEEQIFWLENSLAESVKNGRPVFVINHQPLNDKNGVAELWQEGGLGINSDVIKNILMKYSDDRSKIFYISGHLHKIGEYTFEKENDNLYYLNLPSFEYQGGKGFILDVYDSMVEINGFDFINGKKLPEYKYVIR